MNKHAAVRGNHVLSSPRQYATFVAERAKELAQSSAHKASLSTEKAVRRHPLSSLGFAFGGGVAVAILGYLIFSKPREPRGE